MGTFILSKSFVFVSFAILTLNTLIRAEENFDATYGSSPAPFEINVHPSFIEETVHKVSRTRYTVDVEEPDLASGPPRHNVTTVRDYWVNHYDWFDVQNRLNQRYVALTFDAHHFPKENGSRTAPRLILAKDSTISQPVFRRDHDPTSLSRYLCTSFTTAPTAQTPYLYFSFMAGQAASWKWITFLTDSSIHQTYHRPPSTS